MELQSVDHLECVFPIQGRFIMAFDATYLTATLCQMRLHGQRGLVGGMFSTDNDQSCFFPMKDDVEFLSIPKASTMLECLAWEPNLEHKLPLAVASIPVQHSFAGAGATHRGNFYMLEVLGKVLDASAGLVLGVVFDAAGQHQYVRRLVHGCLDGLPMEAIQQLPFWKEIQYECLPKHPLPRLPIQICKIKGQTFWALCGICSWALLVV